MAQVPANQGNQGSRGGNVARRRQQHPLDLFRRQLNSLFESFWGAPLMAFEESEFPARMWDFNVTEDEKEIVIRAEMPGFEENDLDIRIQNDVLMIRAEKQQKENEREEYRSFFRTVSLPAGVDAEKAQATYQNGVLELRFARPEGTRPKRIAIQGGKPAATGQPAPTPHIATEKPRGEGSHAAQKPTTGTAKREPGAA